MPGPGVAAYLILSVILFATGAFGVLIRRSPLIVLLALEIMLNAGNLALIAFARQTGNELVEQTTVKDEFVHFLRRR